MVVHPTYPMVRSFKVRLIETSKRMAILHAFYLPVIFVTIGSLFVSFSYLAYNIWYNDPFSNFFEEFFRSISITMSVLSVPLVIGIVLRILFSINLASDLVELGKTYPNLYHQANRASNFLKIGVAIEIASVLVIPLVGNFIGVIIVLVGYNNINQIFEILRDNGLYEGKPTKPVFQSYMTFTVIFALVSVIALTTMNFTNPSNDHFIPMILPLVLFAAGMVWYVISLFRFSQNMHLLKDPTQEQIMAAQSFYPQTRYAPYVPPVQYAPVQYPHTAQYQQQAQYIPPRSEQEDFVPSSKAAVFSEDKKNFCTACGSALEPDARFCPTCGKAT